MLTVCRLAGRISAGKNGEETVIIKVFRNVTNEQWKLRTEISPILHIIIVLIYITFYAYMLLPIKLLEGKN